MSKITKQQAFEFLTDMEVASEDGNSSCDQVAVSSDGKIVAYGFSCQKEGCNCVSGWWNGNSSEGEILNFSELKSIADGPDIQEP